MRTPSWKARRRIAFASGAAAARMPITGIAGCCAHAASGHAAAAPPSSVMKLRRPLSSMALSPPGGRPSRSQAQGGRLGGNVYPQQRHHEDQNRINPDSHDVGPQIPPLLYRLLLHGGSPWVAIARMDLRTNRLPPNGGPGPWGKPQLF